MLIARGASLDSAMEVALKGASGGFEEFEELPGRAQYEEIVGLLRELANSTRRSPPTPKPVIIRRRA